MNQYIVTIKYNRSESGVFDKGIEKIRVNAGNEEEAREAARKHQFYPIGSEIIRIRRAAYKKNTNPKGAGAKPKYNEETTTFSCRVPVSKKSELSKIVAAALKRWLRK